MFEMIDKELFYQAATQLFTNIDEIKISTSTYSDSSFKILKLLKKKCRKNDLRNLKCLYKLWMNPTVRDELKQRLDIKMKTLENLDQEKMNRKSVLDAASSNINESGDSTISMVNSSQHDFDAPTNSNQHVSDEPDLSKACICSSERSSCETPMHEHSHEGFCEYSVLLRGELKVSKWDTVYLLRGITVTQGQNSSNEGYKTIDEFDINACDIFRVERLWKNFEGERFVYGHHYLRPLETFCERNRKFFRNEIVRVPSYEVVPIELVMGQCWVLDPGTYCKGRPVTCDERHLYICELRMDRLGKTFSRIRQHHPICLDPDAFRVFDKKLKIKRDFAPHFDNAERTEDEGQTPTTAGTGI